MLYARTHAQPRAPDGVWGMTAPLSGPQELAELPTVAALLSLAVFSADQAGAYREHSPGRQQFSGATSTQRSPATSLNGLRRSLTAGRWSRTCRAPDRATRSLSVTAHSRALPRRWSVPTRACCPTRSTTSEARQSPSAWSRRCCTAPGASAALGAAIVNVNRQRLTPDGSWHQLIEYVAREELWDEAVKTAHGERVPDGQQRPPALHPRGRRTASDPGAPGDW